MHADEYRVEVQHKRDNGHRLDRARRIGHHHIGKPERQQRRDAEREQEADRGADRERADATNAERIRGKFLAPTSS